MRESVPLPADSRYATFLLTPEGKVHMIWLGYADYFGDDIKKVALELLRQQPGGATRP